MKSDKALHLTWLHRAGELIGGTYLAKGMLLGIHHFMELAVIEKQALQFSPSDRALLADHLLQSLSLLLLHDTTNNTFLVWVLTSLTKLRLPLAGLERFLRRGRLYRIHLDGADDIAFLTDSCKRFVQVRSSSHQLCACTGIPITGRNFTLFSMLMTRKISVTICS